MNMNFDFNNPTRILFGSGKLNELGDQPMPGKKALLLMSGGLFDTPALLRMAAVLLCSCAGGVLGRALGEKKRRI